MRFKTGPAILIAIAMVFSVSSLNAEDIKNYADCDVCHGGIHYGPDEAKEILGKECFDLFAQLDDKSKTIKIDLDGVRKPGSKDSPNTGYEIMVWGVSPFYIKDLRDGSKIQIINHVINPSKPLSTDNWVPDIYLYAAKSDEIDLKDAMDVAWEKLKSSGIYFWVLSENENKDWNDALKNKILEMLKLMTKK